MLGPPFGWEWEVGGGGLGVVRREREGLDEEGGGKTLAKREGVDGRGKGG